MTTETIVAIVSAVVAILSFGFNAALYRARRRLESVSEVIRLHERWWSPEIKELRERVIKYVRGWETEEDHSLMILASYTDSNPRFESQRYEIGVLAYFFADLNAAIEEGVANERFAYRLFGKAQFFWFAPFLKVAAQHIEARPSTAGHRGQSVRWVSEVRALERRFRTIERRRAQYRKVFGFIARNQSPKTNTLQVTNQEPLVQPEAPSETDAPSASAEQD
ncbi:MAG: hypothetical protein AAGD01_06495 [Acidobacteriota bacterium]